LNYAHLAKHLFRIGVLFFTQPRLHTEDPPPRRAIFASDDVLYLLSAFLTIKLFIMKRIFLISIFPLLLLSCDRQSKGATLRNPQPEPTFFVSGIYVNFEKSSYCRTWDTLVVTKDRHQINVYRITRLTSFQRNLEEDYDQIERNIASWTGSYDASKAIMHVLNEGRPLIFRPSTNAAYLDNHVFTKIE
jgi:hypothetical protein